MAGIKVIGTAENLLAYHGGLQPSLVIAKLAEFTELSTLNIEDINKVSESGLLYVEENGHILDGCDKNDEHLAKYKIVPLGVKKKYSERPLMASFTYSRNHWWGALIGDMESIFGWYRKEYKNNGNLLKNFSGEWSKYFGGRHASQDITGFGLQEVLYGPTITPAEPEVETDELKLKIIENDKAIKNLNNRMASGKKTKASKQKLKQKLDRLLGVKAELEKEYRKEHPEEFINEESAVETVETVEETTVNEVKVVADVVEESAEPIKETTVAIEEPVAPIEPEVTNEKEDSVANVVVAEVKENSDEKCVKDNTNVAVAVVADNKNTEVKSEESSSDEDVNQYSEVNPILKSNDIKSLKSLAKEVYEKLLFKEDFANNDYYSLVFYLYGVLLYIRSTRELDKDGNGYMWSKDNKKMLINTNLIDTYGNFIYLLDHTARTHLIDYKIITIMKSKTSLVDEGFDSKKIRQLPGTIKFTESPKDLVFDGDFEDFDLEDEEHLNHIINERRHRFPDAFKEASCKTLCDILRTNIKQAVEISKIDYRYILPMLNMKNKEMGFLVPCYLSNHFGQTPELAIIITQKKGLWKIFTILPSADAYANARLVCNPKSNWYNINN